MDRPVKGGFKTVFTFLIISFVFLAIFTFLYLHLDGIFNIAILLASWILTFVFIGKTNKRIRRCEDDDREHKSSYNLVMLILFLNTIASFFSTNTLYIDLYDGKPTLLPQEGLNPLLRVYYIVLASVYLLLFVLVTIANKKESRGLFRLSFFIGTILFLALMALNVLLFIDTIRGFANSSDNNNPFLKMYFRTLPYEVIYIVMYIVSLKLFYETKKDKFFEANIANTMAGACAKVAFEKGIISQDELNEVLNDLSTKERLSVNLALNDPEARKEAERLVEMHMPKERPQEVNKSNQEIIDIVESKSTSDRPQTPEDEIMSILNKNSYK